jgi:hypothetical protein
LDWLRAKYRVTAVPNPVNVVLNVPGNLHKTFHVDLVERAADNPLPSQKLADARPGPLWVQGDVDSGLEEYWEVERVVAARNASGRGRRRKVLVKWKGYENMTWEPLEELANTEALAAFEKEFGNARENNGPSSYWKRDKHEGSRREPHNLRQTS